MIDINNYALLTARHSLQERRCLTTTPPRRTMGGGLLTAISVGLFGAVSYVLGSLYPPSFIAMAFAPPAPPPIAYNSPKGQAEMIRIDELLCNLPQVKALELESSPMEQSDRRLASTFGKENPSTTISKDATKSNRHYSLSRPYANFPPHMAIHSLTSGSLRKPNMLAAPPLVLSKTKHGASKLGGNFGDAFAFLHLGRSLCGHDGIVHGGLLATVLDESLARTSFFHLPHHIGVTARLEIDYRKPVKADQVVVVETKLLEAKGRKVTVEAKMRDLQGELLVESRSIFVEPRWVWMLNTSAVKKVIDVKEE